jgi:hypothetical protein
MDSGTPPFSIVSATHLRTCSRVGDKGGRRRSHSTTDCLARLPIPATNVNSMDILHDWDILHDIEIINCAAGLKLA